MEVIGSVASIERDSQMKKYSALLTYLNPELQDAALRLQKRIRTFDITKNAFFEARHPGRTNAGSSCNEYGNSFIV